MTKFIFLENCIINVDNISHVLEHDGAKFKFKLSLISSEECILLEKKDFEQICQTLESRDIQNEPTEE